MNKPSKLTQQINSPLLAIVAEGFFSRLSFGVISFALPLYAYHLGLSVLQIGVLVTLNEAAALVLKPMMGWVADRYGLKRTHTTSIGLRSLVALLLAVAQSPWQLYGIKTVHGMSKAMRDPSSSALIAEQGGKKAIASAFAWYHTAKIVAGSFLTFLINGTAEMLRGLFPILATQYAGLNEAQTGSIYMASTLGTIRTK